ncbi:MAG TPA: ATP-binding cassette domain-containing protein [Longimicrobiales bacterium]
MVRVSATLTCHELTIRSGKRVVVDSFTWACAPPGVVWVTGSNGSGKSSLLQVIAGWRKAAAGSICWMDGAVAQLRYHAPALTAPPALQVGQFTGFATRHAPVDHAAIDALYPPGVGNRALFGRLSTGEAKRLLLWALLRNGDGALVLDEPYEHLARDAKAALTAILRDRAARRLVIVATNQDVSAGEHDTTLHVDDARIRMANGH